MKRTQLDMAKIVKKKEIKEQFQLFSKRPVVDTGYGYSVDAGREDLQNFEGALSLGVTQIRAADNNIYSVTTNELQSIITKIKANGLAMFQKKWELEKQIDEAQSEVELKSLVWENF
jgi:hypothetical protein